LISEAQLRESLTRKRKAEIQRDSVAESMINRRQSVAAQLASLDAQVRTVDRELAEARQKAAMAITRADRPGLLTYVLNEVGTAVRPGDVLARIADPDRFRIESTISDIHASRIAEGQEVEVPIGDARLQGRIERVLPAVADGALRFWVALEEPSHPALRTNLRTDVLVVVDRREDVLRLAKGPYTSGTGTQTVFVVEGTVARRQKVRLGLSGYKEYEVVDGLAEGDEVVLSDMNRFLGSEEVRLK
jgi:HlyD family secretion protein